MVVNKQMQQKESMDSKWKYVLSSFHLGCIIKEASKDLLSIISFDFYMGFYHSNIGTVDYRVLSLVTHQEYRIIYNVHTILFLFMWPMNQS
jgi:hypothetical protein